MDDKFRLAFVWEGRTPSASAYTAPEALVFTTLREALKTGKEQGDIYGTFAYISYKYLVFEPVAIEVLYRELVAEIVTT